MGICVSEPLQKDWKHHSSTESKKTPPARKGFPFLVGQNTGPQERLMATIAFLEACFWKMRSITLQHSAMRTEASSFIYFALSLLSFLVFFCVFSCLGRLRVWWGPHPKPVIFSFSLFCLVLFFFSLFFFFLLFAVLQKDLMSPTFWHIFIKVLLAFRENITISKSCLLFCKCKICFQNCFISLLFWKSLYISRMFCAFFSFAKFPFNANHSSFFYCMGYPFQ